MRLRNLIVLLLLALVLAAAALGVYRFWFYEEERAAGPMARDLVAAFVPSRRPQALDDVAARHIDPQADIVQRQSLLRENGFDCVIRPANVRGSRILSCRRPVDGSRYCHGFGYYAYETAAGEIIDNIAYSYSVDPQDRVLGRCRYDPPRVDG